MNGATHTKSVSIQDLPSQYWLPLSVLSSYLFFLVRRPISESNTHYLERRLDGMKSLAPLFRDSGVPLLTDVAHHLSSLQPANFLRCARKLQLILLALAGRPLEVPADFVISSASPGAALWEQAKRVLLVLGPGIGIGDEIIFFPAPYWLKNSYPDVRVTVLSGYQGLWEMVNGVDEVLHYSNHQELLQALRGGAGFDLVLLAEFEKPRFGIPMCFEPGVKRYVELSLGAQSAVVVDHHRHWVHNMPNPREGAANYYFGLVRMLEWLGIRTRRRDRFVDVFRRADARQPGALRIFVTPFTSKSNPSSLYWSRLLASLFPGGTSEVEFVLDPGANYVTEKFASLLMRSAASRSPAGIRFTLARSPGSRTLKLNDVFAEMEKAHAVICADSFAAHAAPLFGCTTIVMANPGLENWRVPFEHSYYFSLEDPLEEVVSAARLLLCGAAPARSALMRLGPELENATVRLRACLEQDGDKPGQWRHAYRDFVTAYRALIDDLPAISAACVGLLRDCRYERSWADVNAGFHDGVRRDLLQHLTAELEWWENTNLRKFLAVLAGTEQIAGHAQGGA